MWASTRSSSGDQVCFSAALVGDEVRVSIVVSVVGADADTVAGAGAGDSVGLVDRRGFRVCRFGGGAGSDCCSVASSA